MREGQPYRSRGVRALRLRAVLASGLVLGVGAAVTLASWTDREFATGSFQTSVFNTQSSVNGGAYADNAVSPGATVTIAGPFAPGVSAYFPVLIQTTANSVAGTAVLNGAVLGGTDAATLGAALVYRVVRTTGTCNAAAFTGTPSFVVGAAATTRALTVGQETGVTNPLAAATTTAPGAATGFCFEVTLPAGAPNSLQGKTTTATWQFVTTSN
ncbi:SipW-dependent-type signal peptide-containing protein [Leifsonia naganoensis]|uniref:Putative ribosomally synthesized peptide with SipW-like signal peptide n=1 Tax=Leifsonia naganoensis TaxID=150025 RepID=A0A853DUV9_9MICO|nr:SipW-dependent-type signal peptide-containing protein [Leifsonia naganoensis]NYK10674.1 putative ribosomally synthesized peptide with SipW-like signal peptide [Leifsonia naganoensis]